MGIPMILEHEPGEGCVVHAPALPGGVSQGGTRAEALADVHKAVELYIEDCVEAGGPVPKALRPRCTSSSCSENGSWQGLILEPTAETAVPPRLHHHRKWDAPTHTGRPW